MYNLFVAFDENAWNGETFKIEISRCIREYTDIMVTKEYGELNQSNIDNIKRLPCIFAYEAVKEKDPKFGFIQNIILQDGYVHIKYKTYEFENFLSHLDILEMELDLDIGKWEMSRTHWAIKDVDLLRELKLRGISVPAWVLRHKRAVDITKHQFDVALSFPGEFRSFVESIAEELEREMGPDTYFYDNNYIAQLARPSLDTLLQDIYKNRSKLVVVFLCEKYQEKEWCGIEFRAIRDIIKKREHNRIMYIKMDDGEVEGVLDIDGYVDGRGRSPAEIVHYIKERVDLL